MVFSTGQLAKLLGADLHGDANITISGVDAADRAQSGQISFARSLRYANAWKAGLGSAVLVGKDIPLANLFEDPDRTRPQTGRAVLVVPDADLAMIVVLEKFAPPRPTFQPGVHPSAVVEAGAVVDSGATIGPNCTVSAGACIGAGTVLISNNVVGRGAKIGARTILHPCVVVGDSCEIGSDCTLYGGVVIGADGFGYHPHPEGKGLVKIPHIGNVVIEDHVEIGANSTVDRGKFGSTTVGAGTKIDNQVQIGHNCRIGRSCVLCGQVGLSGSVIVGDGAMIGGRVGVTDNTEIGAGSKVGGFSGVHNNVPPGAFHMGMPAGPANEWRRIYGYLRRLGRKSASTTRLSGEG